MTRAVTILPCAQRSPAWVQARLGRLTASRAADMLAVAKGGEAASRRNLKVQLALERITNQSQAPSFVSAAMRDGIAREGAARDAYEAATGTWLTTTGFVAHDTLPIGCSLDGHLADADGSILGISEIKSPLAATHLEALETGLVPVAAQKQVLHSLYVTGAAWADFVSFHPDFPPALQLQIVRVERDDAAIALYARLVAIFLAEVAATVATVRALRAGRPEEAA